MSNVAPKSDTLADVQSDAALQSSAENASSPDMIREAATANAGTRASTSGTNAQPTRRAAPRTPPRMASPAKTKPSTSPQQLRRVVSHVWHSRSSPAGEHEKGDGHNGITQRARSTSPREASRDPTLSRPLAERSRSHLDQHSAGMRRSPSKSTTSEEEGAIDENEHAQPASQPAPTHASHRQSVGGERSQDSQSGNSWVQGSRDDSWGSHTGSYAAIRRESRDRYSPVSSQPAPPRRPPRTSDTYRPGKLSGRSAGLRIDSSRRDPYDDWERDRLREREWDRDRERDWERDRDRDREWSRSSIRHREHRDSLSALEERDRLRERDRDRWGGLSDRSAALHSPSTSTRAYPNPNAVSAGGMGKPAMRSWGSGSVASGARSDPSSPTTPRRAERDSQGTYKHTSDGRTHERDGASTRERDRESLSRTGGSRTTSEQPEVLTPSAADSQSQAVSREAPDMTRRTPPRTIKREVETPSRHLRAEDSAQSQDARVNIAGVSSQDVGEQDRHIPPPAVRPKAQSSDTEGHAASGGQTGSQTDARQLEQLPESLGVPVESSTQGSRDAKSAEAAAEQRPMAQKSDEAKPITSTITTEPPHRGVTPALLESSSSVVSLPVEAGNPETSTSTEASKDKDLQLSAISALSQQLLRTSEKALASPDVPTPALSAGSNLPAAAPTEAETPTPLKQAVAAPASGPTAAEDLAAMARYTQQENIDQRITTRQIALDTPLPRDVQTAPDVKPETDDAMDVDAPTIPAAVAAPIEEQSERAQVVDTPVTQVPSAGGVSLAAQIAAAEEKAPVSEGTATVSAAELTSEAAREDAGMFRDVDMVDDSNLKPSERGEVSLHLNIHPPDSSIATDVQSLPLLTPRTQRAREEIIKETRMHLFGLFKPDEAWITSMERSNKRLASQTTKSVIKSAVYGAPREMKQDQWMDEQDPEAERTRARLMTQLLSKKRRFIAKLEGLRQQYKALDDDWQRHCARLNRLAESREVSRRPMMQMSTSTPVVGSAAPSAAAGAEDSSAALLTPMALGAAVGRANRRSNQGAFPGFGDAVRSEAEFLEILASLESADMQDPNMRAARTTATAPDMLIDPDSHLRAPQSAAPLRLESDFDDDNGFVKDPVAFFLSDFDPDFWSEEEKITFEKRYLLFPKQFGKIAAALPDKTPSQCVRYYYLTKKLPGHEYKAMSAARNRERKRKAKFKPRKAKGSALMADLKSAAGDELEEEDAGASPLDTQDLGRRRSRMLTSSMDKQISTIAEEDEDSASRKRVNEEDGQGSAVEREEKRGRKGAKRGRKPGKSSVNASAALVATPNSETAEDSLLGIAADPVTLGEGLAAAASATKAKKRRTKTQISGVGSGTPGTPTETTGPALPLDEATKRARQPTSSYWSVAERNEFLRSLAIKGKDWDAVAEGLSNKSAAQARNFFQRNSVEADFAEAAAIAEQNADLPLQAREEAANVLALRRKGAEADAPKGGTFSGPGGMSLDSSVDAGPRGLRINSLLNDEPSDRSSPSTSRRPSVPDWFRSTQEGNGEQHLPHDTDAQERLRSSASGVGGPRQSAHETPIYVHQQQQWERTPLASRAEAPNTTFDAGERVQGPLSMHFNHQNDPAAHSDIYSRHSPLPSPAVQRSSAMPPPSSYTSSSSQRPGNPYAANSRAPRPYDQESSFQRSSTMSDIRASHLAERPSVRSSLLQESGSRSGFLHNREVEQSQPVRPELQHHSLSEGRLGPGSQSTSSVSAYGRSPSANSYSASPSAQRPLSVAGWHDATAGGSHAYDRRDERSRLPAREEYGRGDVRPQSWSSSILNPQTRPTSDLRHDSASPYASHSPAIREAAPVSHRSMSASPAYLQPHSAYSASNAAGASSANSVHRAPSPLSRPLSAHDSRPIPAAPLSTRQSPTMSTAGAYAYPTQQQRGEMHRSSPQLLHPEARLERPTLPSPSGMPHAQRGPPGSQQYTHSYRPPSSRR
ncbi:Nuclear receptor coregulator SMRT/SMRTER, contains Myb-like domains [Ceraceosorus bombacis]|uniref:Nuclear receptor coregulator SMRT/SMRTER, contains Myb-like domains n=2 Tax=Ceraceosorus TaxID=401624 RepID=A0A0N7L9Q6_9BASI|nr:Nuclear receptor coregulator SMRT/SMRTER, contains Myb-like domains [Ceraceosorus bombacis]